jgi:glycosyltransferase involved in cell wall biosynthesis
MRVCLVGDFSAKFDEGFKNVTRYLDRYLSKDCQLIHLNVKQSCDAAFWLQELPKPDVIHYISAPSMLTFVLLSLLRLRWPEIPRVVSALHPSSLVLENSRTLHSLTSLSRPTLVLVQTPRSAAMFRKLGCRVDFLPNGVSTERFLPVTDKEQRKLRNKYCLAPEQYIALHVGHLSRKRNIQLMSQLQADETQVLVVGSTYLGEDQELSAELERQGCIIWRSYFPHIEEIYALADCFVFPTQLGGSLFMPLSVMEALACNLPVISTPSEGLTHFFEPGEGLVFSEATEIPSAFAQWRRSEPSVSTRSKIKPFSWTQVVGQLKDIYESLDAE